MELTCDRFANGGDAIGRDSSGRVVFVDGAMPGERVEVTLMQEKKDFARGIASVVLTPSPNRVTPACAHVAQGCGGCSWQHIAPSAQLEAKRELVVDALRRIGKLHEIDGQPIDDLVRIGVTLPIGQHRTSVRLAVVDGRAGYRIANSHDVVVVDSCLVADPVIEHIVTMGRFHDATEVSVRRSLASGEVLVLVDPSAGGVDFSGLSLDVVSPEQVIVVGVDEVDDVDVDDEAFDSLSITETIAAGNEPVTFRISPQSFFQTRTDGAHTLVAEVEASLDSFSDQHVLFDLYGGVGLFAATAGRRFKRVVTVEREGSSSADAFVNLRAQMNSTVVRADVDRFDPSAHLFEGDRTLVVADPSRAGLGTAGVATVLACEPEGIVLISCDLASLGRDAKLLSDAGYQLKSSTVIDLFPHTPHVEVVTVFVP
jgi:23S rRNA (uracil1939-C5)-methyltransferase